jgi:hypothetical protein
MGLSPLERQALEVGFWLLMVPVAAFILRNVCGLFRADLPSWPRAVFMVLFVGPAAYLVFDLSAYLIFLSMQDVLLRVPPGYGYGDWFREPLLLKWRVVGLVPLVQYLPVVLALCAAGVFQTVTLRLQVPFRKALLIFVVQWAATLVAVVVLSYAVNFALAAAGWQGGYEPAVGGGEAPGQPSPDGRAQVEVLKDAGQAVRGIRPYLDNLKTKLDPYLDDVKATCEPVTRYLPEGARHFLDAGGWWFLLGAVGFLALVWFLNLWRRLVKVLFRPRRRKKKRRTKTVSADLGEDLAPLLQVWTEEGPERLTVKGLSARARLVVLAAGSRDADLLEPEMADRLLDLMRPGLSAVVAHDTPRVVLWPPQYSGGGFSTLFAQKMRVPDPKGTPSRWVLVSGTVAVGRQKVHVGLVLLADQPSQLRQVVVHGSDWPGVLGVVENAAVD